jgi:hypothetical protein
MKYLILVAALSASLIGMASSHAQAKWRQGPSGTECTSHTESDGDVTTTCNPTPGQVYEYYGPQDFQYQPPVATSPIPQHSVDGFKACVSESMGPKFHMDIRPALRNCMRSGENKYHWPKEWLVDACVFAAMPLTDWSDEKVRPACEDDYRTTTGM